MNTTDPWHQFRTYNQQDVAQTCRSLHVMTAGRGTGKILMNNMTNLLDRPYWAAGEPAEVDGEPWRTVICVNGVDKWIREQDPKLWVNVSNPNSFGRVFDIAEPLYLLLMLRWPK
jgi:hypothetical protein